jgi:FkbM family methyltransferase
MSDEHSREVFLSVLEAHATLDYKLYALSPGMTAYVDVQVPFRHKYRSFVDCGAYTGDTLSELVKWHQVGQYIGFEPDMQNFVRLAKQSDALSGWGGRAVLLPLGVSDKNEFLRFLATGGGNSKIDEAGDVVIQTVRLDDMLKGYDDLMIKMDIEGAEIAALHGAKGIITETKPDLAICVYHRVSDLWRIPLIIKDWVPEYTFFMRNHFISATDTILYATVV